MRSRAPSCRAGRRSMCGIAGIVNTDGTRCRRERRSCASPTCSRIAVPMAMATGSTASAMSHSATGGLPLSIPAPAASSRWSPATAVMSSSTTARSTISSNCAASWKRKASAFRSQSDTEVILAAWQAWGEDMLLRFNGMWALAIFDTATRELFLARDRFGIKPLLYAVTPSALFLRRSSARWCAAAWWRPRSISTWPRRQMFDAFGIEGSERTLYREIQRLPAGHFMWLRDGRHHHPPLVAHGRSSAGNSAAPSRSASRISANCFAMRWRCECAATFRSEPACPEGSIRPP